jgi:hypothetical protein
MPDVVLRDTVVTSAGRKNSLFELTFIAHVTDRIKLPL